MRETFCAGYFKCQNGRQTLAVIPAEHGCGSPRVCVNPPGSPCVRRTLPLCMNIQGEKCCIHENEAGIWLYKEFDRESCGSVSRFICFWRAEMCVLCQSTELLFC